MTHLLYTVGASLLFAIGLLLAIVFAGVCGIGLVLIGTPPWLAVIAAVFIAWWEIDKGIQETRR